MRNSVILVDQIEQDIAAGHPRFDAIVGATVRRFRPITLTAAAAAVLALIPLLRSNFFGPMATALMGGITSGDGLDAVLLAGAIRSLVPGAPRTSGAESAESGHSRPSDGVSHEAHCIGRIAGDGGVYRRVRSDPMASRRSWLHLSAMARGYSLCRAWRPKGCRSVSTWRAARAGLVEDVRFAQFERAR